MDAEKPNITEDSSLDAAKVSHIEHFESEDAQQHQMRTKKLLRKVDVHLLPFLIVMYLLNFLDRSNLSQARQGTLEQNLGMTGTDFNLATSIFFVGYLLMQLPSNMLITRVRPSVYLCSAMALWGVVSTCNAAAHSFGGLVAVRFFLGFVEAPFFPGAIFLMSSWYTRSELTRRISWFYSGSALANMFGGLLGAVILGHLDGDFGLAGWRWLFIIEGVITIGIALLAIFFLPDYPATTRWLSAEEKHFAAWRLLADFDEADLDDEEHHPERGRSMPLEGLRLALRDGRLYLFILLQHVSLLSQTFQYFFPAIVGTLGYGAIDTLWLTAPVWFATFLVSVLVTWTSARTRDRSIHIICLMLVAALGNAIATATTNVGARFFAMFLMPMGAISAYQIIVCWVANSFPRPMAKRSAAIAIANMVGNTASIYGAYMYPGSAAPRYLPGGSADAVICVLVAAVAWVLRWVHLRENKKLAAAEEEEDAAQEAANGSDASEGGAAGQESRRRRPIGFRYVY